MSSPVGAVKWKTGSRQVEGQGAPREKPFHQISVKVRGIPSSLTDLVQKPQQKMGDKGEQKIQQVYLHNQKANEKHFP